MSYERSQSIERRLEFVLELVKKGRFSTTAIADQLGVSVPTASRCIDALRGRGYAIQSEKTGIGWRYKLESVVSRKPKKSKLLH